MIFLDYTMQLETALMISEFTVTNPVSILTSSTSVFRHFCISWSCTLALYICILIEVLAPVVP